VTFQRIECDFFSRVIANIDRIKKSEFWKKRKPNEKHKKASQNEDGVARMLKGFLRPALPTVSQNEQNNESQPRIIGPIAQIVDLDE